MKKREIVHGFRVDNIRHFDAIAGDLVEMTHVKTLAKVLWIDREDENKTFGIGFKTVPSDDTGVFHILEHSVLNGSERYPVKEPFVDLLKGSLQTFLNAMTFPDKTFYPVSSRNDKDFINLMRVYLDAVFHPLCIKEKNIFLQEGWHYEFRQPKDIPLIKGVVYNEMKGAYSQPGRVLSAEMMKVLFPDTNYSLSSGGHPKAIPQLTYEQFVESHEKFYSPTNSFILLDGAMDIEQVLNIIDEEYLSHYEMRLDNITIDYQKPVCLPLVTAQYAINREEDATNKSYIDFGYVFGDFKDREKIVAFGMIDSALASTNQSVLKKAILQQGLAEDMEISVEDGLQQCFIEFTFINANPDDYSRIKETLESTLRQVVHDGIDKSELTATLNKMEFAYKERDFHGAPKGLVYVLNALGSWLYGGDPADGLIMDDVFKSLREKIQTNYFEELINEDILHSSHCGSVILNPNKELEDEENYAMKKQMVYLKKDLSVEQMDALIAENEQFDMWQKREDTPEQKATLPKLTLKDLSNKPQQIKKELSAINDIPVLYYSQNTEGIDYYRLYFNLDDMIQYQLPQCALLTELLTELPTAKHSVVELDKLRRMYLGGLNIDIIGNNVYGEKAGRLNLCVSYSCLDENKEEALQLVMEMLYECLFDDQKLILDLVKQLKFAFQQSAVSAGHMLGIVRAGAMLDEEGATKEGLQGYTYYSYLKDFDESFDESKLAALKELYGKLFTANRLTLSLMGENKEMMANKIVNRVKQDYIRIGRVYRDLLPKQKEGIVIASQVSYALMVNRLNAELIEKQAAMMVINKILSLDYLWNEVRVKNGAYGSGVACRARKLTFYSYRDPSPIASVDVYEHAADYLDAFCASDQDLSTYIIGAVGDDEPLLSNSGLMKQGDLEYFAKITYEKKCEDRRQMLTLNKKKIKHLAKLYRQLCEDAAICVVGSQEELNQIEGISLLKL